MPKVKQVTYFYFVTYFKKQTNKQKQYEWSVNVCEI